MSSATWPLGLPQKLLTNGYSRTGANNLVSTSFDSGDTQVRRKSTSAPQKIAGNVLMTSAQAEIFWTFYEDTLLSGSQRFDWNDPVTGAAYEFLIDPATQPIETNIGGDYFQIALSLWMYKL